MNPKHVTNLKLSKQLFEAGITKDFESEFYWVENTYLEDKDPAHKKIKARKTCTMLNGKVTSAGCIKYTPALLLDELLELMPRNMPKISREIVGHGEVGWEATCEECREVGFDWYSPLVALSKLATYLLREGKFNNNKK